MGNDLKRTTGKARTYFLLLLLFSAVFSFVRWSSDGGVAESFSFFGRATGMAEGGTGNAAAAFGFTYMKTRVALLERRRVCCHITRLQTIPTAKCRTQFPGPSIEILGPFRRPPHVSKRANHSESQGITAKKLLRHLASTGFLLLQDPCSSSHSVSNPHSYDRRLLSVKK